MLGMLGVVSLGYFIMDARAPNHYDEMVFLVLLGAAIVIAGEGCQRWLDERCAARIAVRRGITRPCLPHRPPRRAAWQELLWPDHACEWRLATSEPKKTACVEKH